jgi:hypothetical protein
MFPLLQLFTDIAFWRKGPQDAPASAVLLGLTASSYILIGFGQLWQLKVGLASSAIQIAVHVVMLAAMVAIFLALAGKPTRWLQTMIALTGVGTLMSVIDLGMTLILSMPGISILLSSWQLLSIVLALVLFGRILQQALETGLVMGMALTFAILVAAESVTALFIDVAPSAAPK